MLLINHDARVENFPDERGSFPFEEFQFIRCQNEKVKRDRLTNASHRLFPPEHPPRRSLLDDQNVMVAFGRGVPASQR